MISRSTSIFAIASVIGGLLAYAAYFDHKRRNNADFRKQLRKDQKRAEKSATHSKESLLSSSTTEVTAAALRDALEQVKNEEVPESPQEKESYFMSHVSMGEQLSAQGPDFHLPAAMSFYRALRVYPAPVELIVIYQKTVPEPIFKMVMDMTNLDVKARLEGYYDAFPPKSTDVVIETRENRQVVVAAKDLAAGEVIYKENPVVAALNADLQATGTYCAHCLRHIQPDTTLLLSEESNRLACAFCSKACLDANKAQSHSLLFTTEPPLPPEIAPGPESSDALEKRLQAQEKFVAYIKKEGRAAPLLVARFVARQIALETNKIVESVKKSRPEKPDYMDAEGGEYQLGDHIERLRYLDVNPDKEEFSLLVEVLKHALPGLEHFLIDERHKTLHGKVAYNAYGVTFGESDDKPERPDVEVTRTSHSTQRQIGSALYILSSYLSHSCAPSTRPSFSNGTAELHLIATRDVKKGEVLTVAYVDVTQRPDESVLQSRRRRRFALARGWSFGCTCERCEEEGKEMSEENRTVEAQTEVKDGSKVEGSLRGPGEIRGGEVE